MFAGERIACCLYGSVRLTGFILVLYSDQGTNAVPGSSPPVVRGPVACIINKA